MEETPPFTLEFVPTLERRLTLTCTVCEERHIEVVPQHVDVFEVEWWNEHLKGPCGPTGEYTLCAETIYSDGSDFRRELNLIVSP